MTDRNRKLVPDNWSLVRERALTSDIYHWSVSLKEWFLCECVAEGTTFYIYIYMGFFVCFFCVCVFVCVANLHLDYNGLYWETADFLIIYNYHRWSAEFWLTLSLFCRSGCSECDASLSCRVATQLSMSWQLLDHVLLQTWDRRRLTTQSCR